MDPVSEFATKHMVLLGVLAYLGTAAVSTMPPKDQPWNWQTAYGWFYDWIHLVINSRNQLPIPPQRFGSAVGDPVLLPAPSKATLPAQPKP